MQTHDAQTISQALAAAFPGACLDLGPSWWGFGGVHGGLALGLLTAAMRADTNDHLLQQVSGQFCRPLRAPFTIDVQKRSSGKSVQWCAAHATTNDQIAITASAVFAASGRQDKTPVAPQMPIVPSPSACPVFTVPPEFVPFARHTEIRPVGSARPFSGGLEPELIAWLRLVDDDLPPDEARLVVLMDALAPSYGAVLHKPIPIPTITLTVTLGSGLATATSPWLLLRARTEVCRRDGWLLERLDAWTPDGAHLGSGEQLRIVMDTI